MAFNFNWSPLTADATFYTRAQDLLTNALNKSPKPPIIVDDILVSELNLGSVPPELEILEVGDLAEDRFRGIFKMRYSGNAFLTLKTRVQANPMNTYVAGTPSFTSPGPLAAGSSLTIPIKITLSDIKLSAFIILVFSKSKGLTLVFRNDPLESLKVSSTFDSIPFVRDFLQRTIEQQLRNLLMEDVPAIIHRLSLRLFVPEYRAQEEALEQATDADVAEEEAEDPFSSPPQDPVDLNGNPLGAAEITALALENHTNAPSVFSQSSLLRLTALTDSHRTLSPFTPNLKDVLYKVWAGRNEQFETAGVVSPLGATLSRRQSQMDLKGTTYTFSQASDTASQSSRPSLLHSNSSFSRSNLSSTKSGKPRKRKNRVINLRKKTDAGDLSTIADEGVYSETASTATSDSASQADSAPASAPLSFGPAFPTANDTGEVTTPPLSPEQRAQKSINADIGKTPRRLDDLTDSDANTTVRRPRPHRALFTDHPSRDTKVAVTSRQDNETLRPISPIESNVMAGTSRRPNPSKYFQSFQFPAERPSSPFTSSSSSMHRGGTGLEAQQQQQLTVPFPFPELAEPGGILEQAWMMKWAGEIAKRMQDRQQQEQHSRGKGVRRDSEGKEDETYPPPPPYAA